MKLIRETAWFRAVASRRGVRITCKERRVDRQSRVVSLGCWEQLKGMSDSEFNGTCIVDLGIGVFQRNRA